MKYIGLFFVFSLLGFSSFGQGNGDPVIKIRNLSNFPILFCGDSIAVSSTVTIVGAVFDEATEGIKVSIANYQKGEDMLVYHGQGGLNYRWDNDYGYMEITGIGSASEYTNALHKVFYKNLKEIPTVGRRNLSISLKDVDYLPSTKHFYRYISSYKITWKDARDDAEGLKYYGLQGYLATITSSVENDFIWTKINGVGWIGASDSETEGIWKWVTGPEKDSIFWEGAANGSPYQGAYSNWSSGEPNNVQNASGDEDYAHINQNPQVEDKSWNDLFNAGTDINYYIPQGYVVEFGGMEGDPEVELSASVELDIYKIAFSNIREYTICESTMQELNIEATEEFSYSWSPNINLSANNVSNPMANPTSTIIYQVVGTIGSCVDTAWFKVNVNPKPIAEWQKENTICEGSSIVLNPGNHSSYLWKGGETLQTLETSEEGWYSVELTSELGCVATDSTEVKISLNPEIDYNDLDTLVCGSFQQELNLSFDKNNVQSIINPLQSNVVVQDETTLHPKINVGQYGKYDFELFLIDEHTCESRDTISIDFHNQPTAQFQKDEAECEGYNLKLLFEGSQVEAAEFMWYSNGELYDSGTDLDSIVIPLGYGEKDRTVGLIINEQGCVDSLKLPVTVTPFFNFWPKQVEGCTPLNVEFDQYSPEEVESYSWDFGDGITSNDSLPSNVYTNGGIVDQSFDVQLTIVSKEGCDNTGILHDAITVHPIPTIDFDFEESACYPDTFSVNYKGSANDNDMYYWGLSEFENGEILEDPLNKRGPFQFARLSAPTADIGLKVVSEFGCTTDSIIKTFKRKPVFQVVMDSTEGCPPLNVTMNIVPIDSVDEVSYSWEINDEYSNSGEELAHEFSGNNSLFSVNVTSISSITGCSDSVSLDSVIFIYPVPDAQFTPNPSIVLVSDPIINFENQSTGANFYEWNFDDHSFLSEEENPQHKFLEIGWFDILLTAINEFGCVDTTVHEIIVAFDRLYPPNAFSPNSLNEENREFRIHAEGVLEEGYLLRIYNRWGEVIFESESPQKGWDGKMKNETNAPTGVYNWVIQYTDLIGEKHNQKGAVTLLY